MLTEPIVEGAYYEREDGQLVGPAQQCEPGTWWIGSHLYRDADNGEHCAHPSKRLTRRVYLVPTDPAEVVADIRRTANETEAHFGVDVAEAETKLMRGIADFVAEKLGVKS